MRGTTILSEGKTLMENQNKTYREPVRGQVGCCLGVWFSLTAREAPGSIQVYPPSDIFLKVELSIIYRVSQKLASPQDLHSNDPNREELFTRARTIS